VGLASPRAAARGGGPITPARARLAAGESEIAFGSCFGAQSHQTGRHRARQRPNPHQQGYARPFVVVGPRRWTTCG